MTVRSVLLDPAVDDPALVHRLIDAHQPYWPVQRYFANSAEYAAMSGSGGGAMIVAPVFRGNWAFNGDVLPGVAPLLESPRFADAAREVFGASIVRPDTVYVNLTWQLPFPQGAGHTDVPAFRGFDRTEHPITFLTIMGLSGLFEDVRVKVATAVAWFYTGADGGFEYWPDGPDAPSTVHEGTIDNTAIVADNDFMWHRVRPTGQPSDGMVTLGLDAELRGGGGEWSIAEGGSTLATFPRSALRVSLSWKATCFTDEADRRRHDDHTDDITLAEVLGRFRDDLGPLPESDDPERDPRVIEALQERYVHHPSVFAS